MDADELLKGILERSKYLRVLVSEGAGEQVDEFAVGLAEDIEKLDSWLSNGGFLPARWCVQLADVGEEDEGSDTKETLTT